MGQLSGRVELYMVYVSTMFHLLLPVYSICLYNSPLDTTGHLCEEEDDVLWPHSPKNSIEKRLIQWKVEGKRRRCRPAKTWFQDFKEWIKLDMADASKLATDRERWFKLISHSSAVSATWMEGERNWSTIASAIGQQLPPTLGSRMQLPYST